MARVLFHVSLSSFREPRFHAALRCWNFAGFVTDFGWFYRPRTRLTYSNFRSRCPRFSPTIHLLCYIRLLYERRHARSFIGSSNSVLFSSNRRLERVTNFDCSIGIHRRLKSFEQLSPAAYINRNRVAAEQIVRRTPDIVSSTRSSFIFRVSAPSSRYTVPVSRAYSTHFLLFLSF